MSVDSEILPARLRAFTLSALEVLSTAQLTLARLQEDYQSIVETGLAGRDPDVSVVMKTLNDAGIRSVRSFAQYLAEATTGQRASEGPRDERSGEVPGRNRAKGRAGTGEGGTVQIFAAA